MGVPNEGAQLLVGVIVSAERIAVGQQHSLTPEVSDDRVRQQPTAGALGEGLAQQKIPIAM